MDTLGHPPAEQNTPAGQAAMAAEQPKPEVTEARKALVEKWTSRIKHARDTHWSAAFKRMQDDRYWAAHGCSKDWKSTGSYTVNLMSRHVNRKTADLYAKNPTCVVKRRPMLEGQLWDGSPAMLMQAQQGASGVMPGPDGMPMPAPIDPMAVMVLQEAQQILMQRQLQEKIARTVELVVQNSWDRTFKGELKQAVRRALTCGVAWIQFDLFRETDKNPEIDDKIADTRTKIAAIEQRMAAVNRMDAPDETAELEQLQINLQNLQNEAEIVLQEGIIYDFPASEDIIPDPRCTNLRTFSGARWVARQYSMDADAIERQFGVDVTACEADGRQRPDQGAVFNPGEELNGAKKEVWRVFDKDAQEEFWIADGCEDFLRAPAPPAVYRKGFWPWLPIIFNDADLPCGEIYPPSDVFLLRDPQDEHNRARQGVRIHRTANRPVYVTATGAIDEDETKLLTQVPAHTIVPLKGLQPGGKVVDILQPVPKAPIDPALYDVSGTMSDFYLIGGNQEAQLGGTSGATATESSIADAARSKETSEDVDSLDETLSILAAEVAAMAISAMAPETVQKIAGPGAAWPATDRQSICEALEVSIRAGSSGRPNQQAEAAKLERLMPHLIQVPGINPEAIARKLIETLDANIDLADFMTPGLPSITAINAMSRPSAASGPPGSDNPDDQGAEGADKAPRPNDTRPGAQPAYGDSGALQG